ncbi:MAG: TonB-dependent receptor, partial [Bryobacteraceae bacterium]
PAPYPHPDALQEFAVLTSSFSAEYGRFAGGTINAVTRSGTNQFHGSVFEFLRNDALNTRSFFSAAVPTYKQNQFGGTIGGPLVVPGVLNGRNRLFFFGSYQGTRLHRAPTQSAAVVPTDAERIGDFSASAQVPNDPLTRAPFPNRLIPASRFDPAARAILDKWVPRANRPNGQYVFNRPMVDDTNQIVEKTDAQLSSKNRLSGRYLYQYQTYTRFQGNLPGFFGDKFLRFQSFLVNDTHTFRSNLLNEFRASYLRYSNAEFPTSGQSYADVGINVFQPAPRFPSLSVSGYFSPSIRRPSNEVSNTFQYSDTVSWITANHSLKFGADLHREQFNSILGGGANPDIGFDGSITRNAYADFLLGLPNTLSQTSGNEFAARRTSFSFFAQDDWKITRRLTLNLGLRYDPLTPVQDLRNRVSAYRPGQKSERFPLAPAGLVFPGDTGIPDATFNSDRNNVAPRLGVAWDPKGDGSWSIRAGYGVFYDLERIISIGQFTSQQPWNLSVTLFNPPSLSDPYRGRSNPFPFAPPVTADQQKTYPFQLPIIADVINPDFRSAYVQQWNVNIQHEVKRDFVVTAAYAGSKGTQLHYDIQVNPAQFRAGATTANTDARRPLAPTYGSLSENRSGANSIYHSMQWSLNKRYRQGYSILTSYTWSKVLDTVSTGREGQFRRVINPYDLNAYRGPAEFDYPHRFVTSLIWELPILRAQQGVFGKLFGGWAVNGIATLQSGQPFYVTSATDRSLSAVGGDQADLIGNAFLPSGRSRGERIDQYFNAAAFAAAAPGTFGTAGRSILRGMPAKDFAFSLVKNTRLKETLNLQLRGELFNAFNRPTLGLPESRQNNRLLGKIQTAGDGRVAQVVVKLSF